MANPKEHGQEITRTQMALSKEKPKDLPANNQPNQVRKAKPITMGTKTEETLSATFAMGAFDALAS